MLRHFVLGIRLGIRGLGELTGYNNIFANLLQPKIKAKVHFSILTLHDVFGRHKNDVKSFFFGGALKKYGIIWELFPNGGPPPWFGNPLFKN